MTVTLDKVPADSAPDPVDPPTWRARLQPLADGRGGWLATLLVAAIGGLLRFVRLDIPGTGVSAEAGTFGTGKIFDEIYYACDAKNLLAYGVERNSVAGNADCITAEGGSFIVHPPLGKWAIAMGEWVFGTTSSFGWRASAALFGTLTIVVLVRAARRMTGSTLLGCLAGLLLCLDGLHFVQSRVAMLDIFLCFWVTAAFACLVVDRDAIRARLADAVDVDGWGPRLGLRPWRLAAGACLGAAVATKWSGLYYVVVLLLLTFAWEVGARRTAGVAAPVRATLGRSIAPLLATLVVLPAALYVLSWAGWFFTDEGYDRQWAATHPETGLWRLIPEPDVLRSWWQYHVEIFGFHDNLTSKHPYQSHPIGWLLLARPVSYYYPQGLGAGDYGCTAASCAREVLAIGNPAIWWASIAMLLACAWLWVSRRDWRAASVVVLVLTAIAPWIRDDLKGRTMFLFYALPAVPFMCLGLALVAGWALGGPTASPRRRASASAGIAVYVAVVIACFAFFYPLLAAQTLPYDAWQDRMWFPSWI